MRFGRVPLDRAVGALLGHSISVADARFRKGRMLSAGDVEKLRAAGLTTILSARLDDGDVVEDVAANRLAALFAAPGLRLTQAFTGRANLYAESAGVLAVDRAGIDALNAIDESATIATLQPFARVEAGQMLATIKIIPFAVAEPVIAAWHSVAAGRALLRLHPFQPLRVTVLQTTLADTKPSVLDKTDKVLAERIRRLGGTIVTSLRCDHHEDATARAFPTLLEARPDLLIAVGASAIVDRADVLPAGLVAAGGSVRHFGMPVDPGNLLLVGELQGLPVLCAPGCARSPKPNGFDWVLERIFAGLTVAPRDVQAMGVGGLLQETASRGLPRDAAENMQTPRLPRIAAIMLAAGRSSRMRGANKLLVQHRARPLVAGVVAQVAAAQVVKPLVVVTGHQGDAVQAALAGLPDLRIVANPHYADGLATSLRAGLAAVPAEVDGLLVCLGDMPLVGTADIDRLIAAFNPAEGRAICVPVHDGQRGNPVLFARRFLPELLALSGDIGARHIVAANEDSVCEVTMPTPGVLTDVDTPEALAAVQAQAQQ
jgi:molybdenum cofactor cytidylyltransferase